MTRGNLVIALLLAVGACNAAFASEPLTRSERRIESGGDMLQYAIPASALLATFLVKPAREAEGGKRSFWSMGGTPRHDLLLGLGRSWAVTGVLKFSIDARRPNGGTRSFPSGHTSFSFAGAEFIRKEYGWGWGTPALLLAGFVGWSRVQADQHHTGDVVVGAAIGVLANHDFWRRKTRIGSMSFAPAMLGSGRAALPGIAFELKFP
jgi:membrane-associated phospholipid phosphatase